MQPALLVEAAVIARNLKPELPQACLSPDYMYLPSALLCTEALRCRLGTNRAEFDRETAQGNASSRGSSPDAVTQSHAPCSHIVAAFGTVAVQLKAGPVRRGLMAMANESRPRY